MVIYLHKKTFWLLLLLMVQWFDSFYSSVVSENRREPYLCTTQKKVQQYNHASHHKLTSYHTTELCDRSDFNVIYLPGHCGIWQLAVMKIKYNTSFS